MSARGAGLTLACATLALAACGDNVLDLGQNPSPEPPVVDGPRYATRDELAADESSEPGVPTVIATHQYGAMNLVIDETRVYWVTRDNPRTLPGQFPKESSVVRSCAKADCAGTLITYAFLQGLPEYLAVNRTTVFWARSQAMFPADEIVACPIAGCDGPPKVIIKGVTLFSFQADDTHVYWQSHDATLLRCPVQGCAGLPELVVALNEIGPQRAMTLDATHLYWLTGNGALTEGRVATAPKDGSAAIRYIAEGLSMLRSIAVQGETVYFSEFYSGGWVKSCPVSGCGKAPTVLASSLDFPTLLDVDGDRAYWFQSIGDWYGHPGQDAAADLMECPLEGCGSSPTVLATELHGPLALAVDATHFYWASSGERKLEGSNQYSDSAIKRMRRRR
jgi:hypothetical protein